MQLAGFQIAHKISFIVLLLILFRNAGIAQNTVLHPSEIAFPVAHDVSPPLLGMPILQPSIGNPRGEMEIPNQNYSLIFNKQNSFTETVSGRDPVLQDSEGVFLAINTIVNIEGIGKIYTVIPPDPAGDVGTNQYIQATNLHFAIYSKSGALLYGPAALSTIWQGFPGPHTSDGDPVVLYDHLADRWLITQFSLPNFPNGPYYELIALSQTPDPLGAWHRYSFQFDKMPDYPKVGVWSDGYYMSANLFSSGELKYKGPAAIVLERDSMLTGKTARMMVFELGTDKQPLLAADLDGQLPPSGSPGYFLSAIDDPDGAGDHLELFSLHTNWGNLSNSTLTGPQSITVAAYDGNMCNGNKSCIPQAGTTRGLDALSSYLMMKLQYRNFGSYQVLMTNQTVDVEANDHAGIRWYELRSQDTNWSVYQQGTYAPDANHRWIGSIAMDGSGNVALAYSVSGAGIYPSIRATGRRAGDPPGYMSLMEATVIEGTGAQNDASSRWGDYSCLTVDPVDNRTFWYTNEYYGTTSTWDWKTRIASFTIDNLPVSNKKHLETGYAFNLKCYPNPLSNLATITWQLKTAGYVELNIYDFTGRKTAALVNAEMPEGMHQEVFDAAKLPEGMYFCLIRVNGVAETVEMIVTK